jgi:hypothetical protein
LPLVSFIQIAPTFPCLAEDFTIKSLFFLQESVKQNSSSARISRI